MYYLIVIVVDGTSIEMYKAVLHHRDWSIIQKLNLSYISMGDEGLLYFIQLFWVNLNIL